jgi:hypothetical protein
VIETIREFQALAPVTQGNASKLNGEGSGD